MQSKHPALLERTRIPGSERYPAALGTAEAEGKAPIPGLTETIAMMKSCTPIDLPRTQYGQVLANYLRSLQ